MADRAVVSIALTKVVADSQPEDREDQVAAALAVQVH